MVHRLAVLWMLVATILVSAIAAAELQTAEARLITIPRVYQLDGRIEAVHQSTLAAQTTGQVELVLFDVDDFVERGSLILVLKDTEQKARLTQAQANLKAAQAKLQDTEKEYRRIKDIYEKKLVAKADVDKVTAALKTARANKEAADAALEQAEEQYAYTRVKAPFEGIVTERHIEVGEIAQPGKLLMSGISLEKLRVTVDVPQNLMPMVRVKQKAMVQSNSNGWVLAEKLTIFPYAEPGSNSFKVRMDLPPEVTGLFPGMLIKVAFVTGDREVLAVPEQSVVYRSEVIGIYVVDEEGRIGLRHVRIGHPLTADRIAIISGLTAGEKVAVDPIAAGAALKAQRLQGQAAHE